MVVPEPRQDGIAEAVTSCPELPAPRLQLRWVVADPDEGPWFADERFWECHYELVLPLDHGDIRREIWKDGEQVGERSELVVAIKQPTRRGGSRDPCVLGDGTLYADTPFRDGAHARWDAALLGGLPIYVIALDGSAHNDVAKPSGT